MSAGAERLIERLIVIPVSLSSKRLPNKAMLDVAGKPLFTYAYESACRSRLAERVMVATGERAVEAECARLGVNVFKNTREHPNGTSRSHEVAAALGAKYVVNCQLDTPAVEPAVFDEVFRLLERNDLATVAYRTADVNVANNRNRVKVVLSASGEAVYFSRSLIPSGAKEFHIHVGVYGYTKQMLDKYVSLPKGALEASESLEQLRFIENGYKFRVVMTSPTPSIDTPEDLDKLRGSRFSS